MGKAGGCASGVHRGHRPAQSRSPMRYGPPPDRSSNSLRGIRCHVPAGFRSQPDTVCRTPLARAGRQVHLQQRDGGKLVGQLEMPIAVGKARARIAAERSSTKAVAGLPGLRVLKLLVGACGRVKRAHSARGAPHGLFMDPSFVAIVRRSIPDAFRGGIRRDLRWGTWCARLSG